MRTRSISFYSLEDLNNQIKQQETLSQKKEEDALSSDSTYSSFISSTFNYYSLNENEEDEDESEQQELNNINEINRLYESDEKLLQCKLKDSEDKMICKCIKESILSKEAFFINNTKNSRSQTMTSIKDIKLKNMIYLMLKARSKKESLDTHSFPNFLLQNMAGDENLKIMISSNSTEQKNKFISQLFSDNDSRLNEGYEEDEDNCEGNGSDLDNVMNYNDKPSMLSKKTLLNIIKKKMLFNNKVINLEIFDTEIDFYKQQTATAYYKIPKVFIGIIDNDKTKQPLEFAQMLHQQFSNFASNNQKLILIDVNYSLGSRNIELYCNHQGITYIPIDKDYSCLPISVLNYLILYATPERRTEYKVNWHISDCLKRGFEYSVEEAFLKKNNNRPLRRHVSLANIKTYLLF